MQEMSLYMLFFHEVHKTTCILSLVAVLSISTFPSLPILSNTSCRQSWFPHPLQPLKSGALYVQWCLIYLTK